MVLLSAVAVYHQLDMGATNDHFLYLRKLGQISGYVPWVHVVPCRHEKGRLATFISVETVVADAAPQAHGEPTCLAASAGHHHNAIDGRAKLLHMGPLVI